MKILDRYILQSLIFSYIICLCMVICFYTVIDMINNFDRFDEYREDLVKNKQIPADTTLLYLIAKYYLYGLPVIFYNLTPVATLMSAMFTLTRMSRCNELVPLKAGGISMYRLLYPFLGYAFVVAVSMVAVHEYVITEIADELESLQHMRYTTRWKVECIQHTDQAGQIFYIESYFPSKKIMEKVRVIVPYSLQEFRPKIRVEAQNGEWIKQGQHQAILLTNGTITEYLPTGEIKGKSQPLSKEGYILFTDMSDLSLTHPDRKNLDSHTISRLWNILKKTPELTSIQLALHLRLTLPLSNFILILLGLPLILGKETRNFFVSVMMCAVLCGIFYGTYLVCANLGFKEVITPIFAAWFPITGFTSWALALWVWIQT